MHLERADPPGRRGHSLAAPDLRRPKGFKLGDRPPLQQVVRWIADLGGYTGKSSGGPPGAIVIGRGMRELQAASLAIRNLLEMKRNEKL